MKTTGHHIVVIGTSAGGMQALERLLGQLPADFPAAIFIVQHLSAEASPDFLVQRLGKQTPLACVVATNGATFRPGTVYLAPPDHHLLIKQRQMLVAKGPRENQFRPSIDPLFRSAAAFHGPAVVGVILTGMMSDGMVGMEAVERSGGVLVVQDPADAEYPDLPRNVIRKVGADHIVTIAEMGRLLDDLARTPIDDGFSIPSDVIYEAGIAERIMTNSAMTNISDLQQYGDQVPYGCPDCGGALWEAKEGRLKRYRCHAGHAYTQETLFQGMNSHLEETLWVALRILEERRNMLESIAEQDLGRGQGRWAASQADRAKEMKVHIDRIREILLPQENPVMEVSNGNTRKDGKGNGTDT